MRPDTVVVAGIGLEHLSQVGLAKDDDVIQAFSSDRADEPFDMSILPGRMGRSWSVPNPHGSETSRYGKPIRGVSVPNEVSGCLIPREGLGDLTRDPLRCRMVGDGFVTLVNEGREKGTCREPSSDGRAQVSIAAAREPRCVEAEVR